MEEEEPLTALGEKPVAFVQPCNPQGRRREKRIICRQRLLAGIHPVSEEGETKASFRIGQVMNLQPLDQLLDFALGRQERRDGDQRPKGLRHAALQLQPGKVPRDNEARDEAVHECDRRVRGRHKAEKAQQKKRPGAGSGLRGAEKRQPEDRRCRTHDRCHVARRRACDVQADEPATERNAVADLALERGATLGNQVVARVMLHTAV